MKYVTFLVFIFGLFFLSPRGGNFAEQFHPEEGIPLRYFYNNPKYIHFLHTPDQIEYLATATAIVYHMFPDYSKEFYNKNWGVPIGSVGPALLSLPFTYTLGQIDKYINPQILVERHIYNLDGSWVVLGFVLSSIFYVWLSCLMLYTILIRIATLNIVKISLFLFLGSQGLFYFTFPHAIMTHAYEFFIQTSLVFLMFYSFQIRFRKFPLQMLLIFSFLIFMMILVRYNNINFVFAWILIFSLSLKKYNLTFNKKLLKAIGVIFFVFLTLFVFLRIFPAMKNGDGDGDVLRVLGYFGSAKYLSRGIEFKLLIKRIFTILFWPNKGMIFIEPFVLISIFALFLYKFRIKKHLIILFLASLFNFWIVIKWGAQESGNENGGPVHRYMTFSILPFLIIPFTFYLNDLKKTSKHTIYLLCLYGILPFLSSILYDWIFKYRMYNHMGITLWGNNDYIIKIFEFIFYYPIMFFKVLTSGFLYYIYLLLDSLFNDSKLTDRDKIYLLQFFILYISPWTFYLSYLIFHRSQKYFTNKEFKQ